MDWVFFWFIYSSPLGRGFLTGAIKSRADLEEGDWRLVNPRFSEENFPKNLELVNQIHALAEKKGVAPSELVLAWVLAQGKDFFVIPGTKKVKYLEQNVKGGQIQLSNEDLEEMQKIIKSATISGSRY